MFGNDIALAVLLCVPFVRCIDFRIPKCVACILVDVSIVFCKFLFSPYSSSGISLRVRVLSHRSIRWQFETSVAERSAVAGACVFTVTRRIYVDWQAKERKLKPTIYYVIGFCVVFAIYSMQSI